MPKKTIKCAVDEDPRDVSLQHFKNKSLKTYKRSNKNSKRQIRRKRSRLRYYKSLKKVRYNRTTEDLCSAVKVVDIADMDWAPMYYPSDLPSEVIEWQKQDQIAFWKSRAISLELENKMLKQHLRNVYAKTIEDESLNHYYESVIDEETTVHIPSENKIKGARLKHEEIVPNIPENKNRIEEMNKIYGEKAQKLMGMETAIQLNFERHVEQLKPAVWPTLPLNLKFD